MENYKKIITDLIQAHMQMVGPGVALSIAQKNSDAKITDNGEVLKIGNDPEKILNDLINAYSRFVGPMSKKITDLVMEKYPDIDKKQ